ncbi:MAG: hypothetical protein HC880_10135 [Bacteroidia bacterium]|nr:hypothetical protein [Bacteroidia bacterium]
MENIEINTLFLERLKQKIEARSLKVENATQKAAILVNNEIEIVSTVMEGTYHPAILPLFVFTTNRAYFPNGIQESLAGLGENRDQQIDSAIDNYLQSVFLPLMESFSDKHQVDLDFTSETDGKEILWHPKLGKTMFQGKWKEIKNQSDLYSTVKEAISAQLVNRKLNWLKLYVARQANGEISGECLLNNEVWKEGYQLIEAYAQSWDTESEFLGQKQFVVFRRCDAYDEKPADKPSSGQSS